MKCLVCGKNFNGNECPVCSFPVVEIPGDDFEAGMRALEPAIQKHRSDFVKRTSIGITVYNYELSTNISDKGSDVVMLGTVAELVNEKWLSEQFEAVPSRDTLSLGLSVWVNDRMVKQHNVIVPNIKNADKLRLGISTDNNLCFTVLLGDTGNNVVKSQRTPLIGE